ALPPAQSAGHHHHPGDAFGDQRVVRQPRHPAARRVHRSHLGQRREVTMLQDLRYALRGLRRSPGFAAVAIITLALGIGVNTTVFSILEALVLRPLPVADPERVVLVESNRYVQMSIPDYLDLQHQNTVFAAVSAYRPTTMAVERGDGAQQVFGYLVTG